MLDTLYESWALLKESAVYVLFGIAFGGLLKVFLSPQSVVKHLGRGRFWSVIKAALLGIPMPLCSCGVLPAASSLRKQGANKGATTAFLISTPESGVDSIAITYALLDPLMTIARPVSAFVAATTAGLAENLAEAPARQVAHNPDLSCQVDGCCDGEDCPPEEHSRHHSFITRLRSGFGFAFGELWHDIASWFFVGLLLAGLITALVPQELVARFLGGGLSSMLLMLLIGIPLYICASASTPIAAAMILKGVSPGAALVFLLVGPATNITSLTVLIGVLGKRATVIYLTAIAVVAVAAGLVVDSIYSSLGISPVAAMGQAGEIIPEAAKIVAAVVLVAISIRPLWRSVRGLWSRVVTADHHDHHHEGAHSHQGDDADKESCCGHT